MVAAWLRETVIKEHERPLEPVYFRIAITETSGHKAFKGE